ncbi:MAG TPA: plasma-membrane proton-efflux P-type ATPase [Candidatus Acetothermia bacterium]|nr:plasma-membrane proton-efflux P-type ATPase [Candidatus Acetothermia bacterium]
MSIQQPKFFSGDEVQKQTTEALFKTLSSSPDGLSSAEATARLSAYGANAIVEKKQSTILRFLSYFWGPIPWMIEIAAALSAVLVHWDELYIIVFLLLFNSVIGFWQEHKAANALEALKSALALKALALRDGKWGEIAASDLVPGDYIRIIQGDIVPADVKLVEGKYLSVDQSALTGESLPVTKQAEDVAYSSSIAHQGEMNGLVVGTGMHTQFGRTAELVQKAGAVSHLQQAVLHIADYLIYISLGLAMLLIIVQVFRGDPLITIFQFVLILVVASIPVAMPAVISVTMALGALALSREKAIVSRLQSIEEMAGVDILCSDKTGTLTQNKLTLGEVVPFADEDPQGVILAGALASGRNNPDPIDRAVIGALDNADKLDNYQQMDFVPFDPIHKRTEAAIKASDNKTFKVTKGAPQVILDLCHPEDALANSVNSQVDAFAAKGFRTLGVARSENEGTWQFLGLLPLFDPPREDSAEMIKNAGEHGVQVKMVTGDNLSIAREIGQKLGVGTNILAADTIFDGNENLDHLSDKTVEAIEKAGGFAQVYPEHKYGIVKALQQRGHMVAMTGDGVNDAPALKQAEVGIAVSGATNAARAAAALVLTLPGLSTVVLAIEEARKIFERMNSYVIYRITETIRILFFVSLTMLLLNFYPLTAVLIILLAVLNDLPIMVIAYDNTWLDPKPVRWNLRRVLTLSTTLGLVGVVETFGLLLIGMRLFGLTGAELRSLIYLKLAVAGHLTLFIARTRRRFFMKPYPAPILLGAILGTQALAAAIVGFGIFVTPIPWIYVGYVWAYCLIWMFIEDEVKLEVYRHLGLGGKRHRRFLRRMQRSLYHYSARGYRRRNHQ